MKRRTLGLLLAAVVLAGAGFVVFMAGGGAPSRSAGEDSREAYLSALAEENGISYEEAEALDEKQNQEIAGAADEEVRYATLKKKAGTISDNDGYTQDIYLSVYAKYLYSSSAEEPVELLEVFAPDAELPGISSEKMGFHHGEYEVTKDSTTKSTVVVVGSFSYTQPDASVSVGGNIAGVSFTGGGCEIATEPITLRVVFTLADCA